MLPSVERVRDRIAAGGPIDQALIETMGVDAYIDMQLGVPLTSAEARKFTTWPPAFELKDCATPAWVGHDGFGPQAMDIARSAGHKAGLRGLLKEFWINHLVPGYYRLATSKLASYQSFQEYLYQHSLGRFEDLLRRHIGCIPLIFFMNNNENIYPNQINENLGREILELFGMGVADEDEPPRYDNTIDVAEAARLLSGLNYKQLKIPEAGQRIDNDPLFVRGAVTNGTSTIDPATGIVTVNITSLTRWFFPNMHDPDPIFFTFLPGIQFSNAVDGPGVEGYDFHPSLDKFIHELVRTRGSARFIITKLATWFIGDKPTPQTREALIDLYLANSDNPNQIAVVLGALFRSPDFAGSYADGKRSLRPLEFWSKFLNFFGDNLASPISVNPCANFMENEDYSAGTYQVPAGYPDNADYWLAPGKLTERADMMEIMIPNGGPTGTQLNIVNWCQSMGFVTPRDIANSINKYLLAGAATQAQVNLLLSGWPNPDAAQVWTDTVNVRPKVRDMLRTVPLLDLGHYAS